LSNLLAGICENEPLMAFAERDVFYAPPTAEEVTNTVYDSLLPHQASFCSDLEHRKLALVCGFGAGKTVALIAKSVILAAKNIGYVSALFEPTNIMLRDVLHRSMLEMLEEWKIPFTYRASPAPELKISFKEGSHTILFRTILNYQRLRGQNLCSIGFDEADTVGSYEAEQAMNMALARLRSGNVQSVLCNYNSRGFWLCS
jgi:hypothetical protein